MGIFLNPADFAPAPATITDLIAEAETKALIAVPVLGSLTPDDDPAPGHAVSHWAQVGAILTRVVREWASQGYDPAKMKMVGPFQKSYWGLAGRFDKTTLADLRRIGDAITSASRRTGPRWSMPTTHSLSRLFDTR